MSSPAKNTRSSKNRDPKKKSNNENNEEQNQYYKNDQDDKMNQEELERELEKQREKIELKQEEQQEYTGGYDSTLRTVINTKFQIHFNSSINNPYSSTIFSDSTSPALAETFRRGFSIRNKRGLRAHTVITNPRGHLILLTDELVSVESASRASSLMLLWGKGQFKKAIQRKRSLVERGDPLEELILSEYKQVALGNIVIDGVYICKFSEFTPVQFNGYASTARGEMRIDFTYFTSDPGDFLIAASLLQS